MSNPIQLSIRASDGVWLSASLFRAHSDADCGSVVVINAGAGIPATYYARFAAWLADRGIPTITYDYRGVGASRPRSLRHFKASVEDWGSKDCAAVLETARANYPGIPIAVLGHSIGGFVTGFVRNPRQIRRMVLVAPHTGYFGDYRPGARPWMWLAWHVLMPAATRAVGYFPGRRLGLPEDLPYGVAIEWAQRRKPEFWWNLRRSDGTLDTDRRDDLLMRFSAFQVDALAIRTTDDPFATEASARRIEALFASSRMIHQVVDPRALDLPRIGHFGFFRSRYRDSLWPLVGNWLSIQGRHEAPA